MDTSELELAVFDYSAEALVREYLPHGSEQSAFNLCRAFERLLTTSSVRYFPNISPTDANIWDDTPPGSIKSFLRQQNPFDQTAARKILYAPFGLLRRSPFAARPATCDIPIVCEVGTTYHQNAWRNLIFAILENQFRPRDSFIFKSRRTAEVYRVLYARTSARMKSKSPAPSYTVIPNGVDLRTNNFDAQYRGEFTSRFGLPSSAVIFLTFSRIAPITKLDFTTLVRIWRLIVDEYPEAFLVLAGARISQPDYKRYEDRLMTVARQFGVANNVVLISNPYEIWSRARQVLMSSADVFIHTTRGMEEAAPNVILEASAHGLPLIVSDWSNNAAYVRENHNGFLIPTYAFPCDTNCGIAYLGYDAEATAFALESLVGIDGNKLLNAIRATMNQALRRKFSEMSRKLAEAEFCIDKVASQRIKWMRARSELRPSLRPSIARRAGPRNPSLASPTDLRIILDGIASRTIDLDATYRVNGSMLRGLQPLGRLYDDSMISLLTWMQQRKARRLRDVVEYARVNSPHADDWLPYFFVSLCGLGILRLG